MSVITNGASPAQREAIEDRLTGEPLTQGYRSTLPLWALFGPDGTPQVYLMRDIELMLIHPIVRNALNYFKSGISGAEFEVTADSQEVGQFVTAQVSRYWKVGVPLLQGAYEYGWIGTESCYTTKNGPLEWDYLVQFSPRDTFLLTRDSKPLGVRVKNVRNKGPVDLWLASQTVPAKGLWYAHCPRYNSFYGQSQLLGAWRPWRRLAWKDGLEYVIDMALYRYGVAGPLIRYPDEDLQGPSPGVPGTFLDSQNRPRRSSRDLARQIAEWYKAGAGIGLSSTKYPQDQGGGYKWEAEFPEHTIDVSPLVNAAKYLIDQIYFGIGIPPELLMAGETGSGYSGRQIPVDAYLTTQQWLADALLALFVQQTLSPLVFWNYGPQKWEAKVKSLLLTKKQTSQTGQQANAQNMAQGGNTPGGKEGMGAESGMAGQGGQGQASGSNWQAFTGQSGQSGWRSQGGLVRYQSQMPGAPMSLESTPERIRMLAQCILAAGSQAA